MDPALAALSMVTASLGMGEIRVFSSATGAGSVGWGEEPVAPHPLAKKLLGGFVGEEVFDGADLRVEVIGLAHEIIALGLPPGLRRLQLGRVEQVSAFPRRWTTLAILRLSGEEAHTLKAERRQCDASRQ